MGFSLNQQPNAVSTLKKLIAEQKCFPKRVSQSAFLIGGVLLITQQIYSKEQHVQLTY